MHIPIWDAYSSSRGLGQRQCELMQGSLVYVARTAIWLNWAFSRGVCKQVVMFRGSCRIVRGVGEASNWSLIVIKPRRLLTLGLKHFRRVGSPPVNIAWNAISLVVVKAPFGDVATIVQNTKYVSDLPYNSAKKSSAFGPRRRGVGALNIEITDSVHHCQKQQKDAWSHRGSGQLALFKGK